MPPQIYGKYLLLILEPGGAAGGTGVGNGTGTGTAADAGAGTGSVSGSQQWSWHWCWTAQTHRWPSGMAPPLTASLINYTGLNDTERDPRADVI